MKMNYIFDFAKSDITVRFLNGIVYLFSKRISNSKFLNFNTLICYFLFEY